MHGGPLPKLATIDGVYSGARRGDSLCRIERSRRRVVIAASLVLSNGLGEAFAIRDNGEFHSLERGRACQTVRVNCAKVATLARVAVAVGAGGAAGETIGGPFLPPRAALALQTICA